MTASTLDLTQARAFLREMFAPWVVDLGLDLTAISSDGVTLQLPYSEKLCRADKIICGQALMTAIDTCSVFVCWGALGEPRNVTTVSQNTSFLRPAMATDVVANGRAIKTGRTLIFTEVTLSSAADGKHVAHGTSTFAVLPGTLQKPESA